MPMFQKTSLTENEHVGRTYLFMNGTRFDRSKNRAKPELGCGLFK